VLVKLAEAVPTEIVHDIDEFDLQRNRVTLRGVVDSTGDAETVMGNLENAECVQGAKITQITQKVGSDRQRYVMEFDARCEAAKDDKKKKPAKEED
jgi:hypothetical protein